MHLDADDRLVARRDRHALDCSKARDVRPSTRFAGPATIGTERPETAGTFAVVCCTSNGRRGCDVCLKR
jgi:hypothetical protein